MHRFTQCTIYKIWLLPLVNTPPAQGVLKMSHEIINTCKNQFESIQTTFISSIYSLQIKKNIQEDNRLYLRKKSPHPPAQSVLKMSHKVINTCKNQFESIQTTFISSIYSLQIKKNIQEDTRLYLRKKSSISTFHSSQFWQSLLQQQNDYRPSLWVIYSCSVGIRITILHSKRNREMSLWWYMDG